jgi:hypothetical protein
MRKKLGRGQPAGRAVALQWVCSLSGLDASGAAPATGHGRPMATDSQRDPYQYIDRHQLLSLQWLSQPLNSRVDRREAGRGGGLRARKSAPAGPAGSSERFSHSPSVASRGDRGRSPRPDVLRASAKHRWLPTRFRGRGSGSGTVAGMGAVGFPPAAIADESQPRLAMWTRSGRDPLERRRWLASAMAVLKLLFTWAFAFTAVAKRGPTLSSGASDRARACHGAEVSAMRRAYPLRPQSGAGPIGARAHGAQCSAARDAAAARALHQAGPAAALGRGSQCTCACPLALRMRSVGAHRGSTLMRSALVRSRCA